MTGLELLKAPEATAGEIADIISAPCPPTIPAHCDGVSCRACWLSWLTGEPPEEKGPSDEQTAPCGGCPLQGKKRELTFLEDETMSVIIRYLSRGYIREVVIDIGRSALSSN